MIKALIDEGKYVCLCGKILKKKSKSRHVKTQGHLFILRRICDSVEVFDPNQTETDETVDEPMLEPEL